MADGHFGPTVVVKCGGVVAERPEALCADLADRYSNGERLLLVHGGSSDIDRIAGQLGVRQRRLVGPGGVAGRYTDPETLAVVTMVLRDGSGFVPDRGTRLKSRDSLLIVATEDVRDAAEDRLSAVSRSGLLARWLEPPGPVRVRRLSRLVKRSRSGE